MPFTLPAAMKNRALTLTVFIAVLFPTSALAESKLLKFGKKIAPAGVASVTRHQVSVNLEAMTKPFALAIPGQAVIHGKPELVQETGHDARFTTTTVTGKAFVDGVTLAGDYVISHTRGIDGSQGYYGTFRSPEGKLFVLDEDKGTVFTQVDENKQLECGGSAVPHKHQLLEATSPPLTKNISTQAATVRVLLLYTPDAVTTAKSLPALLSRMSNMLANGNISHTNSQTGVTLELAAYHALSVPSSDNYVTELSEATDITDGKWDEIGTLREQYCADMVSVIVGGTNGGKICGIAWVGGNAETMGEYKDQMVSLVSTVGGQVCSQYTFVHELGHNMGSDHDFENASGSTPAYGYSYGWRFNGDSGQQFRTIMAYAPGTRLPYFSSGTLTYDGQALGSPSQADNSTSIINTLPVVSAFAPEGGACLTGNPLPPPIPPNEPDVVEVTTVTKNSKRPKVTFEILTSNNGFSTGGTPIQLTYDKKRSGTFSKSIKSLTTDANGLAKYKIYLDKLKKGFYRACSIGTTQIVCSELLSKR